MSAITGTSKVNRRQFPSELRLPRTIAVGEDKVRVKALIHTPETSHNTLILAHDGQAPQTSLLTSLKHSLLAEDIRILEVELLREEETRDQLIRYDIPLLARRLAAVQRWAERNELGHSSIILGTGNAAAAALWLSTQRLSRISSIVSINGKPHLAEPALGSVKAPTFLLVDSKDRRALHMNRMAASRLGESCELCELEENTSSSLGLQVTRWLQGQAENSCSNRTRLRSRNLIGLAAMGLLRSLISLAIFFAVSAQIV